MGDLTEFSWRRRVRLAAYPWRRIDPVPWTPLAEPLAETRVALVSTAGLVSPGDVPFDETAKGGDPSFRVIPATVDVRTLSEHHRSDAFDHAGILADPNLAFPLDRLRELADRGRIGSASSRHLSFMGSITAPGRLIRNSAPEAAGLLVEDGVQVALLVPV